MEVVNDTPKLTWLPVGNGETLRVGQLIKCINEGAFGFDQALGINDLTHRLGAASIDADGNSTAINNTLYGVVVGTNNITPVFSAVTNSEQIAYASPYAAAVTTDTYVAPGGPWPHGDNLAYVKVALIEPQTVLRSRLYQSSSTIGTALTVGTVTAGNTSLTVTTNSVGVVGISSHSTVYFRSGAAAGQYRVTDDQSATIHAWDVPLTMSSSATSQIGDTLVKVNLRPNGMSRMQISADGTYINSGASATTNFFMANVHRLDLSTAGSEYVEFSFDPAILTTVSGTTT